MPLMDPLVTLFGSIHEKLPDTGSTRSMLFSNFGNMISMAEHTPLKNEEWDVESLQGEGEGEDHTSYVSGVDSDDNLQIPLISCQTTSLEKDIAGPNHGSIMSMRRNSSLMQREGAGSMVIGSGWQLAWKWTENNEADGKKGGFKRIYLHQEGGPGSMRGSLVSLPDGDIAEGGDYILAVALMSQPALYFKEVTGQQPPIGPAMVHPSQTASRGPTWTALLERCVRRALTVGVGIQILQQFAGINGVMYYTPQILKQAGVDVILGNLGIGPDSSSFLISVLTNFLMLPSIAVAMRFMDVSGRRTLLLTTIPVLIVSLVLLVLANVIALSTLAHAIISTVCVVLYFCCFVMGYGPIPNILCAEIFPTRVHGLCIAICALSFWICDVIFTYTLPVMLNSIGLAGVFGIYVAVCVVSWFFVYLRVPETKGMPLEVINEFFSVGAKPLNRLLLQRRTSWEWLLFLGCMLLSVL